MNEIGGLRRDLKDLKNIQRRKYGKIIGVIRGSGRNIHDRSVILYEFPLKIS